MEEDEEEVYEVPVDDIIDTGTVYPEDETTLYDVEDYYKKFDEIEDDEDELIDELNTGTDDNEDEIQTELNILENKEDHYAQLTDVDDTSEDDDLAWMDSIASGDSDDDLSWIDADIPSDDDVLLIEEDSSSSDNTSEEKNDEEEVYEVPVDDIIDTGTVYPEDETTLYDVEDYYKKFDEIEDKEDELIDELNTGTDDSEDEIQTELNILENKEDYYAQLTDVDDTSEDDDLVLTDSIASGDSDDDLSWIEVEIPSDDDVLLIEEDVSGGDDISGKDNVLGEEESFEEKIYTIPVSDAMNDEYPAGDTLSRVDDERNKQDVIDAIIVGSAAGGADPDIGMGHAVIEEDDETNVISEIDDLTEQPESKLRTDERIKQMEGEDDEEEKENGNHNHYMSNDNTR